MGIYLLIGFVVWCFILYYEAVERDMEGVFLSLLCLPACAILWPIFVAHGVLWNSDWC